MASAAQLALVSAQIAGDLYEAGVVARQLLLLAQNSRVLAARVQSEAPGLMVLASFFAEVASQTIKLAQQVNGVANDIARTSVEQWRLLRFEEATRLAIRKAELAATPASIASKLAGSTHHSNELARRYRDTMRRLRGSLEDLNQQMQASQVLAVNFHLESTKAQSMEATLVSMVRQLEEKSEHIAEAAETSLRRIRNSKE